MKKAIKRMGVLALLAGVGYWIYDAKIKKEEEFKPSYDRAKVEIRDVRTTVETTGEIKPRNRLDIKPPIGGRLEELMVDEGDPVDDGEIIGWVSSTERATLLDAARAKSDEEYAFWKELYKPTPLIAPLKGTVIARNFEPGQSIEAKDAVVAIADDLIVVASLDETDIGQVRVGQDVIVRLEAYPDHPFACIAEKVAYDARVVQNITMYDVDVRPDNLPAFARSGMTANLEFTVLERKGVLAIPAAAVQQGSSGSREGGTPDPDRRARRIAKMKENGMTDAEIQERLARSGQNGKREGKREGKSNSGVYVLVDSGNPDEPEHKPVKIGISDGSYVEIIEGLSEGSEVLIPKVKMGSIKPSGSGSPFAPNFRRRSSGGGGRR